MNNLQRKIEILTEFGAGEMIDNTISKLMTFQIARYQKAIADIDDELKVFEKKYTMSSEECYRRFNTGDLGDEADFFEWTGLFKKIFYYTKNEWRLSRMKYDCHRIPLRVGRVDQRRTGDNFNRHY